MNRILSVFLVLAVVLAFALALLPLSPSSAAPNAPAACNPGDVGGTVFRELPVNGTALNTYGTKDANEPGVADVTVTVIAANGTTLTAVTATDGTWAVTPAAYPVRVEFSVPDGMAETFNGTNSLTSVQFADAGNCGVDFGVHLPEDYSSTSNPPLSVPRYEVGDPAGNTDVAQFTIQYNQGGTDETNGIYGDEDNDPDWEVGQNDTAYFNQIGATWGEAYQREQKRLFLSAVLKRHSGLANGLDAIYVLDYTSYPPSLSHFNLQGVSGIDLGSISRFVASDCTTVPSGANKDNCISDDSDVPNWDIDAFAKVGDVGYGDIEMSEDGQFLWAVNLNQKALIQVDVSGATLPGTVTQHTLTFPVTCTGGEMRPWGLKFYQGKGYLGAVCDASTSQNATDLDAYVFSFDPATPSALTTELTFDLDYTRDTVISDINFLPWINTWPGSALRKPQPVFSDIEFLADGTMFLGILDRWGNQTGAQNYVAVSENTNTLGVAAYGEIIKVCSISGSWVLEGAAGCPANYNVGDGIGVAANGDFFDDIGGDKNPEYTMGALAVLQGRNQLLSAMNDPYIPPLPSDKFASYANNSGIEWFSLGDGSIEQYIQTDPTTDKNAADTSRGRGFQKANGVGDVELLLDPAPLELGNRVWCDTGAGAKAGNGVQDPGEDVVSGATVTLVCDIDGDGFGGADDVTATTTTDSSGNYYFKDGDTSLSSFPTATWDSSLHIIPRDASCRILIAPSDAHIADSCGGGSYSPTTPNNGSGSNADLHDSDGEDNVDGNGNTGVTFTTGPSGDNNHTFDFGFQQQVNKDWGDLPDSFATLSASSGPNHVITANLYLGSCVDAEVDGQPNDHAGMDASGGDDNATGNPVIGTCTNNDDEDGVVLTTPLIPGGQACFNVTAHNATASAATIYAWVDWNGDGDFGTGTTVDTNETFGLGTVPASTDWTNQEVCTTVPAATTATFDGGEVHMRFRFTTADLQGTDWGGAAPDGEVEDYWQPLACAGNYVWNDNGGTVANEQDSDDSGIEEVEMRMVWAGSNGTINTKASDAKAQGDDILYTTTTDGNGKYMFCGLVPGKYRMEIHTPPADMELVKTNSGTDDNKDSDGTAEKNGEVNGEDFTITSITTLSTGEDGNGDNGTAGGPNNFPDKQVDETRDFGFKSKVAIGNRVWNDADGNSKMNDTEKGIANVKLQLYKDADGDGVCEPGGQDGSAVMTTTTDANGYYQFLDVTPSEKGKPATKYCVAVVKSSVPTTYTKSSPGGAQNPDTAGDEDKDNGDDGVVAGDYIVSQPFAATVKGQSNTVATHDMGDPDGYDDNSAYMTVDFGFLNGEPTAVTLNGIKAEAGSILWLPGIFGLALVGLAGFFWQRRRAL